MGRFCMPSPRATNSIGAYGGYELKNIILFGIIYYIKSKRRIIMKNFQMPKGAVKFKIGSIE